MNNKYILKQIRKAIRKTIKVYYYLKSLETNTYDEKLQTNIMRICTIDDILSELEIELEMLENEQL